MLHHKEGVASWAKVQALRVRFPAWSASVRSRHLPIVTCRAPRLRCARLRTASVGWTQRLRRLADSPVVQPRKNTRRTSGKCGFDSHRARHFRRAVEFGLSVKSERTSGFKSRLSRQMAGFPARLLSVILAVRQHFSTGRRIGLSLITTRSLVRVQPLAQHAGVAQW